MVEGGQGVGGEGRLTGILHDGKSVRAGGSAGKYSAIISGLGSITINPVTREIAP